MVYADETVILKLSGVKGTELGFTDDEDLESWIVDHVISEVEKVIHDYCQTSWTVSTVPASVKLVANMAGANLLRWMRANNMGPLIKTDDWQLAIPSIPILTKDLKDILAPNIVGTFLRG